MDWYKCQVVGAGVGDQVPGGLVYIRLKSLYNQWPDLRWYIAQETCKREMLATALAAMSAGLVVDAVLEKIEDQAPIYRVYLTTER